MNMSDNTVLITGATAGIGRAFAQRLAELGNTVIACGRRVDRLAELRGASSRIVTHRCDVSDPRQREELARWVISEHPGTNVLINNAGIQLAADLTRPVNLDDLESEVETNLVAPIHLASLFAEHLAESRDAAIINISSGLAFTPIAFMPVYCATKAAIHSFTLSLRHQLKGKGIKVFEIAPPSVDTELGHQRRADKGQTHGGMPVDEFIRAALTALETDELEAAVGPAAGMREKRDELFARMNGAG